MQLWYPKQHQSYDTGKERNESSRIIVTSALFYNRADTDTYARYGTGSGREDSVYPETDSRRLQQKGHTRRGNTLHLDVHNIGDIPITDVRLSAEPPDDWDIVVEPVIIDRLNAESMQTVDISIVPAINAGRDTYQVTIIADSNEIRRVTRFNVRIDAATSKWTWIGAGIALVVIAVFVFIRYSWQ